MGDFDGLWIGIFLPTFQLLWMMFCWKDGLKISVRALMATSLCCFRWLCEMPTRPTKEVGFVCSTACFIFSRLKRGGVVFWALLTFNSVYVLGGGFVCWSGGR